MPGLLLPRNLEALKNRLINPDDTGIFTDVDGTLSDIADSPELAVVTPEMAAALDRLNQVFRVVAVISGRRALEAQEMVGLNDLVYLGNHGLERRFKGRMVRAEGHEKIAKRLAQVKAELEARLPAVDGIFIEDKEQVLAVHYRQCRDEGVKERIKSNITQAAASSGFRAQHGRQVTEIRPDSAHKGLAIIEEARESGIKQVIYVGDDMTDVDAFLTLKKVGPEDGFSSICVAVFADESPAALKDNSDYLVESPEGVREFFEWLAVQS